MLCVFVVNSSSVVVVVVVVVSIVGGSIVGVVVGSGGVDLLVLTSSRFPSMVVPVILTAKEFLYIRCLSGCMAGEANETISTVW